MAGYEIMPEDEVVNVEDVLEELQAREDPIIDLIIHQWKINEDGHKIFMQMHKNRKDKDHVGMLGVAKLFRSQRDCCAKLLIRIADMKENP